MKNAPRQPSDLSKLTTCRVESSPDAIRIQVNRPRDWKRIAIFAIAVAALTALIACWSLQMWRPGATAITAILVMWPLLGWILGLELASCGQTIVVTRTGIAIETFERLWPVRQRYSTDAIGGIRRTPPLEYHLVTLKQQGPPLEENIWTSGGQRDEQAALLPPDDPSRGPLMLRHDNAAIYFGHGLSDLDADAVLELIRGILPEHIAQLRMDQSPAEDKLPKAITKSAGFARGYQEAGGDAPDPANEFRKLQSMANLSGKLTTRESGQDLILVSRRQQKTLTFRADCLEFANRRTRVTTLIPVEFFANLRVATLQSSSMPDVSADVMSRQHGDCALIVDFAGMPLVLARQPLPRSLTECFDLVTLKHPSYARRTCRPEPFPHALHAAEPSNQDDTAF